MKFSVTLILRADGSTANRTFQKTIVAPNRMQGETRLAEEAEDGFVYVDSNPNIAHYVRWSAIEQIIWTKISD